MTSFSVPTNFQPQLIRELAAYPVSEVYGKLQSDAVGGGRLSQLLPSVSWQDLRRQAQPISGLTGNEESATIAGEVGEFSVVRPLGFQPLRQSRPPYRSIESTATTCSANDSAHTKMRRRAAVDAR